MPGAAGESFGRSARRLAAHASRLSFLSFLFFSVSGEVRIHPGTCAFATCSAATSFTPPSSAGLRSASRFRRFRRFRRSGPDPRPTPSPRPSSHAPSAARLVFPFPSRHAYRSASGSVREPSVPPTQNAQSRGFVPGEPALAHQKLALVPERRRSGFGSRLERVVVGRLRGVRGERVARLLVTRCASSRGDQRALVHGPDRDAVFHREVHRPGHARQPGSVVLSRAQFSQSRRTPRAFVRVRIRTHRPVRRRGRGGGSPRLFARLRGAQRGERLRHAALRHGGAQVSRRAHRARAPAVRGAHLFVGDIARAQAPAVETENLEVRAREEHPAHTGDAHGGCGGRIGVRVRHRALSSRSRRRDRDWCHHRDSREKKATAFCFLAFIGVTMNSTHTSNSFDRAHRWPVDEHRVFVIRHVRGPTSNVFRRLRNRTRWSIFANRRAPTKPPHLLGASGTCTRASVGRFAPAGTSGAASRAARRRRRAVSARFASDATVPKTSWSRHRLGARSVSLETRASREPCPARGTVAPPPRATPTATCAAPPLVRSLPPRRTS